MAVGSNSLGLLFKVGVDAGDAQKAFQQLMATNSEFRKGVEEGMKAEAQAFAGVKSSLQGASESAKQASVSFNQVRTAIGQFIGGVTLIRAFHEIAQAIGEIGTRSKEDFDTLQKQVESAGGHITELQRNISQELVGAFDQLKGVSAGFMAEVIETSGPALINLLKDIAKWLTDLRPLAKAVGDDLADTFNRINAIGRTIQGLQQRQQPGVGQGILEALFPPLAAKRALDQMGEFDADYAKHLKNIQDENKKFIAAPAAFDAAAGRKIRAVKNEVDELAKALKDAQKELDKLREKTGDILIQNMEDQLKGLNKAIADTFDVQKLVDWKFAIFDYVQVLHDATDKIVADFARQAQAVPGGGGVGGIPGAPPEIPLPKPSTGGFFEDLHKSLGQSINEFQTWGDIVGGILGQFAQATEQAFAAFILTGKLSGQIFKQLVAQIIASVAIESAVKAIFQLAEGFAALAAGDPYSAAMHFTSAKIYGVVAAVAGAVGLGIGAAGGLGGDAAGAAGGGFGGTTQAPGTVTINQGATSALGIQLGILNALSNITTAPPGHVLQRGAEENPMVIGQANNEAARRDGTVSREFLQISGLRTA